MSKIPTHIIGESAADDTYAWILRTKWPRCLIRVLTMRGGVARVTVTDYDDTKQQPPGKLSHIYSEAVAFLDRAEGETKPARKPPEILTLSGYQPPGHLILDTIDADPTKRRSFVLNTQIPLLFELDAELEHLTNAVWPEHSLDPAAVEKAREQAATWLADYNREAAKAYFGEG